MKWWSSVSRLTLILLVTVPALHAQTVTSSISGRIFDTTGGVLPGATVTITNAETGVQVWNGTADAQGLYIAPSLQVGTYDVAGSLQGFKSVTITGVRLAVDQRARVDLTMSTGTIQETIVVVGESAGQLETDSSSMALVVNTSQVENLPMLNRDILNLLTLAGGVSSGGTGSSINTSQLSINGSRTLNSEFVVDGVSMVSGSTGGLVRLPSTEALRELKVLTASYSAEYGRTAGGFVNAVVKSGTNEYHGGAYEYFRHEELNANNFFNNLRGVERPADRLHLFGASFSGPLRFPGVQKGEDRAFFFVGYEGRRPEDPRSPISSIPDAAFRAGDFSASPVRVIDPDTRQPFPGNRIPANRIDPAAAKIMGQLPLPNAPGIFDPATGRATMNYRFDGTGGNDQDEVTARIDYNAGARARLYGRFTYYHIRQPLDTMIPGVLDPGLGPGDTPGYQVSFGWTQTWSPSLLMDVTFGYLRDNSQFDPPSDGLDVANTLGIQRSSYPGSPRFNVSGYSGIGMNANTLRRQLNNNYQGSLALTWVKGSHVVKTGVQGRLNGFDVFNPGAEFAGIYSFNGELTSESQAAGNPVNALADFLLGRVQTSVYEIAQPTTARRNHNLALFAQDDWRVNRKLTVNAGLRYEYESAVTVNDDIYSRLDPATGRLLAAGNNASRTLNLDADKMNFAPRLGFAYTLNEKTVLRGAGGIFFGQIFSNLGGAVRFPGFTVRTNYPDRGAGLAQLFLLNQGMPLTGVQNLDDPFAVERNASPAAPLAGTTEFGDITPLPSTVQWNFGIQRQLWYNTVLDVSYVGSRGQDLPLSKNFNVIPYDRAVESAFTANPVFTANLRPNPNVGNIPTFVHEGTSIYHSLQARLAKQFSKRFGFQITYTWSKSIDDGSGIFNFSQPNMLDGGQFEDVDIFPGINRGLSAFDRTHTFAAALQYTTGGPWWLRGIETNMIITARSGIPDTITQSNLHPSAGQQRPGLVSGSTNTGGYASEQTNEGQAIRYLLSPNDPAFPFVPIGPLFTGTGATRRTVLVYTEPGNVGRDTMRGPGEFTIDLSLGKRFKLAGAVGLAVRVEAFNVLNNVNLNAPNTMLNVIFDQATGRAVFNAPNYGLITSAKDARQMQLVARLDF